MYCYSLSLQRHDSRVYKKSTIFINTARAEGKSPPPLNQYLLRKFALSSSWSQLDVGKPTDILDKGNYGWA